MKSFCRVALFTAAILVALAISGCAAKNVVTPPGNPDWTLDWSWQQDTSNTPLCSSTVTTSCIKSFTWGYQVGSAQTAIKTTALPYAACPATIPSPADLSCQTPANSAGLITVYDTANSLLPLGGTGSTPYVVSNWVDMNGVIQSSAPATAANIVKTAPGVVNLTSSAHQ